MIGVIFYVIDLSRLAISIYERDRDEVRLWIDAPVIAKSKRPIEGCMTDGSPKVDDLVAFLQEFVGSITEMSVHPRDSGLGCLIDMDLRDWLSC
jgi:hypothetical protein